MKPATRVLCTGIHRRMPAAGHGNHIPANTGLTGGCRAVKLAQRSDTRQTRTARYRSRASHCVPHSGPTEIMLPGPDPRTPAVDRQYGMGFTSPLPTRRTVSVITRTTATQTGEPYRGPNRIDTRRFQRFDGPFRSAPHGDCIHTIAGCHGQRNATDPPTTFRLCSYCDRERPFMLVGTSPGSLHQAMRRSVERSVSGLTKAAGVQRCAEVRR